MTVYTIRVLTNDDIETALRRTGWTQVLRVPALGPCWEWDGADRHTLQEIGDRYGVTKQAIWRLKTGKTWKTSSTT